LFETATLTFLQDVRREITQKKVGKIHSWAMTECSVITNITNFNILTLKKYMIFPS